MAKQELFKSPQELFSAYFKRFDDLIEGQPAAVLQEMSKEFMRAWNDLAVQTVQHPQEWMDTLFRYQRDQMSLWLRLFTAPGSEPAAPLVLPGPGDRRFAGREWRENPVFDYLKQSYLLASNMLTGLADASHLDQENKKKLKFYTRFFADALSPSNFAATNPEVIQHAIDTKGQSLVDGLQHLMEDMEKGRISMTDEAAFKLGTNLATTAGAVIYENDIMQLIQYNATTEKVAERPLLVIPPFINKFYILDLQPENSFVKYAADQGNTVFIISWINPDKEQSELTWDDYLESGLFTALNIVKRISDSDRVNTVAWCVGGTLLASGLAVLQARADETVSSATFFTSLLDFSEPGEIGVFVDEVQVAQREAQLEHTGMLNGKDLAMVFSMLRANDLIWSYVVNNYLKGKTPPPFDILYWNSDPTNLPASMYISYVHNMYLENKLVEPGGLTMCGESIDLSRVVTPSYFLSTIEDHIAPWTATFKTIDLFAGPVEFVLGASGHIAGVINPPAKKKRNYWVDGERGKGAAHWQETASSHPGSWWPHWTEWLAQYQGGSKQAPKSPGNNDYRKLEPAPGRYVTKRVS
ncbi:MAG: class I poly(R)-hydroxyalkanoic acid synthase [Chromatiaceae bacterium]|nr:class I poly(R)-hydroxyalkanoic acid synthase [Chromatiaceae bacterium]MCP5409950.1 class I poly(R)-hydroxyalkanoic acid synthase [Chromatiaceae bacterium]